MKGVRTTYPVGVKLLSGKTFSVTVQPTDTVAALKQRIFEREGIPPQRQNLLVMGKLLQPDTRDLREYNIKAGDMVYVTAGVRGQPEQSPSSARKAGVEPARAKPVPVVDPREVRNALVQKLSKVQVFTKEDDIKRCLNTNYSPLSNGTPNINPKINQDNTKLEKDNKKENQDNKKDKNQEKQQDKNQDNKKEENEKDNKKEKEKEEKKDKILGVDLIKNRADCIINDLVGQDGKLLAFIRSDFSAEPETGNTTRWPRACENYLVYKRKVADGKEVVGMITVGLSNQYKNTFFFAVGIGLEINLECPEDQIRLYDDKKEITAASLADCWLFGVVYEVAQQCFSLGLQIRQLIEQIGLLSVELAGVALPSKYIDPDTGRCCILLAPSFDPQVTRGYEVEVPYNGQRTRQSVLFVGCRLIGFKDCQGIRKDGAEARKALMDKFNADKTFNVSYLPKEDWTPRSASTSTSASSSSSQTSSIN